MGGHLQPCVCSQNALLGEHCVWDDGRRPWVHPNEDVTRSNILIRVFSYSNKHISKLYFHVSKRNLKYLSVFCVSEIVEVVQ